MHMSFNNEHANARSHEHVHEHFNEHVHIWTVTRTYKWTCPWTVKQTYIDYWPLTMFVFKREVNTVHIDPIAHILKYFLIYNIYNYCIHVEDYRRFRFRSITCQWLLINVQARWHSRYTVRKFSWWRQCLAVYVTKYLDPFPLFD